MSGKTPEDIEANANIRSHLRQYMSERGISQTELARRLDSDNGNIKRILSGERGVKAGMVLKISRVIGVNPSRLLAEAAPERFRDDAQQVNGK